MSQNLEAQLDRPYASPSLPSAYHDPTPAINHWVISPGSITLTSDAPANPTPPLEPDMRSTHHELPSDASSNNNSATPTSWEDSKHKAEHRPVDDIASRADIFAGVAIFSAGMLVLIVAMTFYFVNGRSWKVFRGQRPLTQQPIGGAERDAEDLENNLSAADQLSRDKPATSTDQLAGATMPSKNISIDTMISKTAHDPEPSPSTARLEDLPATKSFFALLKGPFNNQHRPPVSSTSASNSASTSTNTSTGTNNSVTTDSYTKSTADDPLMTNKVNMPALTRTKARSSIKHSSASRFLHSCQSSTKGSHSATSVNNSTPDPILRTIPSSNSSLDLSTASFVATPHPGRGVYSYSDIKNASGPNYNNSSGSVGTTLLRLDTTHRADAPRSSSIMGLYGSARSSPNGSIADAASVQAIYSHSLKSAMSYVTQTESFGFDNQEMESKEVVLASADLERKHV
ncbi:hypothetical protein BGZ54_001226 [Gamsiella multidivaricata]|nr:hypothetical protein BGZ54_001226 [Gamsiella multidivaricata]